MIVSFSEVSKWDTCKLQYFYNFSMGLRPLEETESISNGIVGHKLLQSFYESLQAGKTKLEAAEATHRKAIEYMDSAKQNLNSKSVLIAWTMVSNYIKNADVTAKTILVENRFLIPVSMLDNDCSLSNVQIGFTPDVVFERAGGFLDVEDSKFVGKGWSAKKLDMFPQAKLYQAFLRRMGYNISRAGIRFFNLATGKVTTHFEALPEEEETILLKQFVEAVAEIVDYRNDPFKPRRTFNYSTCQYCAYETPCNMEAEGKDASRTFKYFFMQSDYDYTK